MTNPIYTLKNPLIYHVLLDIAQGQAHSRNKIFVNK